MRGIATLHPTEGVPVVADTYAHAVLAAGTAQAFDFPTECDIFRVAVATTAGGFWAAAINVGSTGVIWPAASTGPTTSSTNANTMITREVIRQRPRGSTGFSLISGSSGLAMIEFWGRAARTS